MKLIVKEYLASLKERNELDAILPDLLCQMGLTVFARPRRGTREFGVDIAAVGAIGTGDRSVYLLSVKSGNLTRSTWNGQSEQSLRPSLEQILDVYIPTHLPAEHSDLPVVICPCFGGDVQTNVRLDFTNFCKRSSTGKVRFEEWHGDRLADLVCEYLLDDSLLPDWGSSHLRKALALVDEPDAAFKHFRNLILDLSGQTFARPQDRLTTIRQISVSLWTFYVWSREANNLDAAYRAVELSVLHGWDVCKDHVGPKGRGEKLFLAFVQMLVAYSEVTTAYAVKVVPHMHKLHALSAEVRTASYPSVNRRMFDVLGRIAIVGIAKLQGADAVEDEKAKQFAQQQGQITAACLERMVDANPCLCSPICDDQAIDIFLAAYLQYLCPGQHAFLKNWLRTMWNKCRFAHEGHGRYPTTYRDFRKQEAHPVEKTDDYRRDATKASILYPTLAFWAAVLGDDGLYGAIQEAKQELFAHSTFQYWFPDELSEQFLYSNRDTHGIAFCDVPIHKPPDEYLHDLWTECDQPNGYNDLSAVKHNLALLVLIACRHYRCPVPLNFIKQQLPIPDTDQEPTSEESE